MTKARTGAQKLEKYDCLSGTVKRGPTLRDCETCLCQPTQEQTSASPTSKLITKFTKLDEAATRWSDRPAPAVTASAAELLALRAGGRGPCQNSSLRAAVKPGPQLNFEATTFIVLRF